MKPLLALAPIDGITDPSYRRVIHAVGPADRYYTEFVKAEHVDDALLRRESGAAGDMPTVLQLWGNDPAAYAAAAEKAAGAGFAGLDINLGCAVPKILRKGYCAALMSRRELVAEIVAAGREASLPVSVKTRLAGSPEETEDWLYFLAGLGLREVTLHFRGVSESYRSPARWDAAARYARLLGDSGVALIGNGDLRSRSQALAAARRHGLSGAMIGRAAMDNPAVFRDDPAGASWFGELPRAERIALLEDQMKDHQALYGPSGFPRMKRHLRRYLWDARELAAALYDAQAYPEALARLACSAGTS